MLLFKLLGDFLDLLLDTPMLLRRVKQSEEHLSDPDRLVLGYLCIYKILDLLHVLPVKLIVL